MWTSSNKKFMMFLGIIFLIGILCGIFYYFALGSESKSILETSISNFLQNISQVKINNTFMHIITFSVIMISSFLIIGIPLGLFFIFYNGFLIGFIISNFTIVLGIKGLLFGLVYTFITKLIYLFFTLIFIISTIKISLNVIKYFLKKEKPRKEIIFILSKRCLFCLVFILLNDLFLYFLGDNLIKIFNFLVI